MSWVISLGAGKEQLGLIRAIQAEGFKCCAIDSAVRPVGRNVADHFEMISNRDPDAFLDWLYGQEDCEGEFVGVMAAGTEVPDVMAILAHRLGLHGVPVAAGILLKDKFRYKQVLNAVGVPHTEAYEVYGGSVKALFDQLGYEVVVKPRVSSGSRGVFLCRNDPMGLVGQMADAADADHSGLIMERYQPGPQISAETHILDEEPFTVAFVDRFYESFGREVGGSAPSEWESERRASNKIIGDAARALGISAGTIKSDLVLTEEGPKIIEMTCRLSGGPLSAIVKESTGVDYFREAVRIACGLEPIFEHLIPPSIRHHKKVAVGMNGDKMDWDWSRKYIVKELGKVKK